MALFTTERLIVVVITDMNVPDYEINRIIADYRKLLKLSAAIEDFSAAPFADLITFIEDLLPAFRSEHKDGEIGEGYYALQETVRSDDIDLDELVKLLLCQ